MRKRYLSILAAILALLLAVGCAQEPEATTPPAVAADPVTVTEAAPIASTPEPEPEETPEDPYYFQVIDRVDGFPSRYDLSQEESQALMDMIGNIEPVGESEKQYDYWSGAPWPEGVWYSIFWDAEDGKRESMDIYEGDVIAFGEMADSCFYDCEGVDHELLYEICSRTIDTIEKSEADVAAAMEAFREYFAPMEEKGFTLTSLRYDEAVASALTNDYIHRDGKRYMDEENFIALIFTYETPEGETFYSVTPGKEALLFLTREGPDGEWEFSFCPGELTP